MRGQRGPEQGSEGRRSGANTASQLWSLGAVGWPPPVQWLCYSIITQPGVITEAKRRRFPHSFRAGKPPWGTPGAAQAREMVRLKEQVDGLSARLTASEEDAAATRASMEAAQQREARCV